MIQHMISEQTTSQNIMFGIVGRGILGSNRNFRNLSIPRRRSSYRADNSERVAAEIG